MIATLSFAGAALLCGYAGFIVSKIFEPYRDSTNTTFAVVAGVAVLAAAGFAVVGWLAVERNRPRERVLLTALGWMAVVCSGIGLIAGLA